MEKLKVEIQNKLGIREDLVSETKTEADLLNLITEYIQELIDYDFNKLLLVLYRLDISEKKVKKAIDESALNDAASEIAKLILEREKEKIKSRNSDENTTPDWIF